MSNPIDCSDAVFAKLVPPKKRFLIVGVCDYDGVDLDYLEDPDEPVFDPWGDLDLGMPND